MNTRIKYLLQKFIDKKANLQERRELADYLKDSKDLDLNDFPGVEEMLKLKGEKKEMNKDSAERIYNQIIRSQSQRKNKSTKKQPLHYLAAAVLLIAFIGTGLKIYFSSETSAVQISSTPFSSNTITLTLEDGIHQTINETDSLNVTDPKGNILGVQKGSKLVYNPQKETTSLKYNTIHVPFGKRFELSLSDGTIVHLNAGSSLRFPINFLEGKNREVFLKGEGYFDVTSDAKHPFLVNTGDLEVQVLGTEFNVNSYDHGDFKSVVLVEGKVNVKDGGKESLQLLPNQMAKYEGGKLSGLDVDASKFISWKEGYLTLDKTSLKETIAQLEQYYNIDIYKDENRVVLDKKGSGKILLSDDVDNVLETLSLLTKTQFHYKTNNTRTPIQ